MKLSGMSAVTRDSTVSILQHIVCDSVESILANIANLLMTHSSPQLVTFLLYLLTSVLPPIMIPHLPSRSNQFFRNC
jgi:hypothetical protein